MGEEKRRGKEGGVERKEEEKRGEWRERRGEERGVERKEEENREERREKKRRRGRSGEKIRGED